MKMMTVRGFLTVVLGAMAAHSFADERAPGANKSVTAGKTLADYQENCSAITDKRKKAECEEANKLMAACKGKKAGNVGDCALQQMGVSLEALKKESLSN